MIAGIDPGLDGAIATLAPQHGLDIQDMPTSPLLVAGKQQRELDLPKLSRLFGNLQLQGVSRVVIEHVSSFAHDGPRQAFKFGYNFCGPRAMAAAFGLSVLLVRPGVWKAAFGLTGNKEASRQLATKLMPAFSHLWPLKKHDGRAEAALLALYGSRA